MLQKCLVCTIIILAVAFSQSDYIGKGDVRFAPQMLNYQGYLVDTLGIPITNPSLSMTFTIFDASVFGNQKWTEDQVVSVNKGIFHVLLGDEVSIPDSVFANSPVRYLELTIGGQVLLPRTQIVSAGYAYVATYSDTAQYARNAVADKDWAFRITDGADTTLQTTGKWGLLRAGNVLYGKADSTHINFGVACTTGNIAWDDKYCTIGGGLNNSARGSFSSISGGQQNLASDMYASVGGGYQNVAGGYCATVSGGANNSASSNNTTVSGGYQNIANGNSATIGGGEENTTSGEDATVGGGLSNIASDYYSTVAGGYSNTAIGSASIVAGGVQNTAAGDYAAVGGGFINRADSIYSFVGGGTANTAGAYAASISGGENNTASMDYATVAGGEMNDATGQDATIGGGNDNTASGGSSTVAGGSTNTAGGDYATIGGGYNNITADWYATVAGGENNFAGSYNTTIGGGLNNLAIENMATVGGGANNTASGVYSFVGGGYSDTASGNYATIGGGYSNNASGYAVAIGGGEANSATGDYSVIIGGYADTITTTGHYSYLFGINSDLTQDSTFMVDVPHIRFGKEANGYEFPTTDGTDGQALVTNGSSQLSWGTMPSDSDWTFRVTDGADTTLQTGGRWGLARAGNGLYGNADSTHVNFGVACTTGYIGMNYKYCTIAGGYRNYATYDYTTVSGGYFNRTAGPYATIGGGYGNISTEYATVGGGRDNFTNAIYVTIGGGYNNGAYGSCATVSGGTYNIAAGSYSTVSGGFSDTAKAVYGGALSGYSNLAGDAAVDTGAVVSGGSRNLACSKYVSIGGGYADTASNYYATICGGFINTASGRNATVGGGGNNTAGNDNAVIAGGVNNIASGFCTVVSGGNTNLASESYATVSGGNRNLASESYATVGGGVDDTSAAYYSYTVGFSSKVPVEYTNSAAFNGQTATASGQTRIGALSKAGGSFTIDHPLDPENKILNHYFIEGPEMRNIYEGTAILTASGTAEVILPDYFSAFNRDPHIQLTGVGSSDVFVAEEVQDNRFVIGGKPGTKVYWQVTGERMDQSAKVIKIIMPVEQPKEGGLAGRSLDDEFLVTTKLQLERMGKADGFKFRHASAEKRYEEMKKMIDEHDNK